MISVVNVGLGPNFGPQIKVERDCVKVLFKIVVV